MFKFLTVLQFLHLLLKISKKLVHKISSIVSIDLLDFRSSEYKQVMPLEEELLEVFFNLIPRITVSSSFAQTVSVKSCESCVFFTYLAAQILNNSFAFLTIKNISCAIRRPFGSKRLSRHPF